MTIRSRRDRNQSGVVLVEAAMVTPMVVFLIFSVVWGAMVFRGKLSVDGAAEDGARAATIAADDVDADYQVLSALRPTLSPLNSDAVQEIYIYRATGYDQAPPASCPSSTCNRYVASDLDRPATSFGTGKNPGNGGGFVPENREASRTNPGYIGVYVKAKVGASISGLPTVVDTSSYQVLRLEPRNF